MNHYLFISLGFLLAAIIYFVVEYYIIQRAVSSFTHRVIVNGTRGKSSVTAYIAAGLRAGSIKTIAKITGIVPTIILSDGTEETIKRKGSARVQEQFKIIRTAWKKGADALVMECMSLHPEYQRIETKALKPNLYIITNIGDDHFEEMGDKMSERVESICSAIPKNSKVITISDDNIEQVRELAAKSNTEVIVPTEFVSEQQLPAGVFPQNINIALTALEIMGVNPEVVKQQIITYASTYKYPVRKIDSSNGNLYFVNGFAVNDPPSAEAFINYWRGKFNPDAGVSIILNTRADRPGRTKLFCSWLTESTYVKNIFLTGSHTKTALRILSKTLPDKIVSAEDSKILVQKIMNEKYTGDQEHIIFGIGNIAGSGFEIMDIIESKSKEHLR